VQSRLLNQYKQSSALYKFTLVDYSVAYARIDEQTKQQVMLTAYNEYLEMYNLFSIGLH